MSRAARHRRRVRVGDVVTWGTGERSHRVDAVEGDRAVLDVTAEAGARWYRDVSAEPDGRRLLRVELRRLLVTHRPGAPRRVNRRRSSA